MNMLGEPLPVENQSIDIVAQDDIEFVFDIALAPEFEVALGSNDTIPYYNVDVNDELVERQVSMYTQRAGKYEKVDSYQDNDMLKGLLAELDENGSTKEGGIQVEGAVMMSHGFRCERLSILPDIIRLEIRQIPLDVDWLHLLE